MLGIRSRQLVRPPVSNLVPSDLISPNTDNLIGSGVILKVETFFKKLTRLEFQGVLVHKRIHISSPGHSDFTLRAAVDGLSVEELETNQIGTTERGIGPAYSTKTTRNGVRIVDLYHESFEQNLPLLAELMKSKDSR